MANVELIPAERIERAILLIRGQKVMLDRDLAELYGVTTGRLNEQVRHAVLLCQCFVRDMLRRCSGGPRARTIDNSFQCAIQPHGYSLSLL